MMHMIAGRGMFPFGRPVRACSPSADEPRRLFILGAYPSALHVAWRPPSSYAPIRALPVDNEPESFWFGLDADIRIADWKQSVGFSDAWGTIKGVGRLNGSSGVWLRDQVLARMGCSRDEAWITDCLDTYRTSTGVASRIANTYNRWAQESGSPRAVLTSHPSEHAIVAEALDLHRKRLLDEITRAMPDVIVTLGNAALRVLRDILKADVPARLSAAPTQYGRSYDIVAAAGRRVRWWPLAHPAAPAAYQQAHAHWDPTLPSGN